MLYLNSLNERGSRLHSSENLHHVDSDAFLDLLVESGYTDAYPDGAFQLACSWLKQMRVQEGAVSLAESPAFALLPRLLKELR